ncbi:hypothetical protein GOODEAATRI_028234, partial [Goodea atripinnis]
RLSPPHPVPSAGAPRDTRRRRFEPFILLSTCPFLRCTLQREERRKFSSHAAHTSPL